MATRPKPHATSRTSSSRDESGWLGSTARRLDGSRFRRVFDPDFVLAFPRPGDIISGFLVAGEREIHEDAPDRAEWLSSNLPSVAGALLVIAVGLAVPSTSVAAGLVTAAVLWLAVVAARWQKRKYTLYVLTNLRIIRFEGFFTRHIEWVTWNKVTEVSTHQRFWDRLFRTATIEVHSSGVESLRRLEDLADWRLFLDVMMQQIQGDKRDTTDTPAPEADGEPTSPPFGSPPWDPGASGSP